MLSLFKVFMSKDVLEPVNKVLMSGNITQGKMNDEFESALQKKFDHEYILTLNSATSGITIALRLLKDMLNLNDNHEVLTCPLTCMATNVPILANNLKVKWVDADINTCNMCLKDLEKKITENTRIILFVHWGGNPLDLNKLKEIVDKKEEEFGHEIKVIEDCAHSFCSKYDNKYIGTHGNICVFSLQAIKHLTTGDGGLIFLPNKDMYDKVKLLRWYGIDRDKRNYKGKDFRLEQDVSMWGYKMHMNDINATIGLYNLPHIEGLIEQNRKNANYLYHKLNTTGFKDYIKVINHDYNGSAFWLFSIKLIHKDCNKIDFIDFMKTKNIMVSQVHKRNDVHSCFEEFAINDLDLELNLYGVNKLEEQMVCLPVGWWVTKEDMDNMIFNINVFIYEKLKII